MSENNKSHRDVILLLPWYLNKTLEPEEHRIVEDHVSQCPECMSEIKTLEMIQAAVVESNDVVSVPSKELERNILQTIAAIDESRKSVIEFPWWKRIRDFIPDISIPIPVPVPVLATALIVIQFVAIAALVGKVYFEKPEVYTILSVPSVVESEGPKMLIAFQDNATDKEIRNILFQINGKIIDGPKAGGLYIVQIPEESQSGKSIDKLLEELRANSKVVKLAERAY